MRLIWWKKHGFCDYELCVERTTFWKKEVITIRGWMLAWYHVPSGKFANDSTRNKAHRLLKTIEWGYHNDKERKDTTERVKQNGWI